MFDIIDWPDDLNTKKSIFLTGIPFFGPHVKILQNTKSILMKRDKYFTEKLWLVHNNDDIPNSDTRIEVYKVASKWMKWPNNHFIPCDRAGIVFGFIPGLDIEPEDIIADICKICDIFVPENIWSLYESIHNNDNLYLFFKKIRSIQKSQK